jgi:hypothetical protein
MIVQGSSLYDMSEELLPIKERYWEDANRYPVACPAQTDSSAETSDSGTHDDNIHYSCFINGR